MTDDLAIELAAITGAHGIHGEVRLKLFTDDLAAFAAYGRYRAGDRDLVLKRTKQVGKSAVARFEGIGDRNAAEALRGTVLTVPRSALAPLDEGEVYARDLVGCPVTLLDGTAFGRVYGVENYGAGDILDVERPDGTRVMLPFSTAAVPEIGDVLRIDPDFLP